MLDAVTQKNLRSQMGQHLLMEEEVPGGLQLDQLFKA